MAGFTGSLTNRFDTGEAAGRGRVRAKTGTLTGVHGLAGIAEDLDGNLMAFILVADRVALRNNTDAEAELDRASGRAGCLSLRSFAIVRDDLAPLYGVSGAISSRTTSRTTT